MEVLDRVYKAFTQLETDYRRSKKTRSQFIVDKFGGDIEVGSIIILDAIDRDMNPDSLEDVEKVTEIRSIFANIRALSDKLDTIVTFAVLDNGDELTDLLSTLEASIAAGTCIRLTNQRDLFRQKGAVHFSATQEGVQYVPIDECKVHCCVSSHYVTMLRTRIPDLPEVKSSDYILVENNIKTTIITARDIAKALK